MSAWWRRSSKVVMPSSFSLSSEAFPFRPEIMEISVMELDPTSQLVSDPDPVLDPTCDLAE
jgi:hypothetical protein